MTHLIKLTAEQEMEFLLGWATQTITFCLSLKPEGSDAAAAREAQLPDTSRANAVAIELWWDALAQCGGAISEGAGSTFLQNVFAWCERNLGGK